MNALLGWAVPVLLWTGVTWAGRVCLARLGLIRCRAGDWGTAFLVGFGIWGTLVHLLALAGVPIGAPLLGGVALAMVVAAAVLRWGAPALPVRRDPAWTPAELVLLAAFGAYAFSAAVMAVYFPTQATDAHSYIGRAYFLLHDRTLDLALYHWPGGKVTGQSNISYPPLMSLAFAVGPAFGGWQAKIPNVWFAVAAPLAVYGLLRQHLPRYACFVWALLVGLSPEMLSHQAYGLLNLPAMAMMTAMAICTQRFVAERNPRWLWAVAILSAGAAGIRPDAVFVHAAVLGTGVAFWIAGRPKGEPVPWVPLAAAALAPFVTWGTWTVYMRTVIELEGMGPLGRGTPIGPQLVLMATGLLAFLWEDVGPTFYLWSVALLGFLWRRPVGAVRFYHASFGVVLLGLIVLYSLIDRGYGGGPNEVLSFSYKRSLFYVVPLAVLATALSPPWTRLAAWGKGWFHLGR